MRLFSFSSDTGLNVTQARDAAIAGNLGRCDFRRFEGLRREIRCHLRADVNERIRWFPDVDLSGMSGICGHPRTSLAFKVGSSKRRKTAIKRGICA
jgi:hypothetical protein